MPKLHKIHRDYRRVPHAKPQVIHRISVPVEEDVVIRWKKPGSFIENGQAYRRSAGDEDICSPVKARRLQIVDLVEIRGPVSEIMKSRTIRLNSVVEEI